MLVAGAVDGGRTNGAELNSGGLSIRNQCGMVGEYLTGGRPQESHQEALLREGDLSMEMVVREEGRGPWPLAKKRSE